MGISAVEKFGSNLQDIEAMLSSPVTLPSQSSAVWTTRPPTQSPETLDTHASSEGVPSPRGAVGSDVKSPRSPASPKAPPKARVHGYGHVQGGEEAPHEDDEDDDHEEEQEAPDALPVHLEGLNASPRILALTESDWREVKGQVCAQPSADPLLQIHPSEGPMPACLLVDSILIILVLCHTFLHLLLVC